MSDNANKAGKDAAGDNAGRPDLPPAARRALAEAEARRARAACDPPLPKEEGGRKGPEPTRFGDWEKDGIVSDF